MLPHLGLGGAQRVAAAMAAYWLDRGHDVMVVTLLDHPPDFCLLHSRVERIMLPQPKGLLVRARRFMVRRIERHDASANRAPTGRSERPASEGRRLDGVQAKYLVLLQLRSATLAFVARRRLLGRSSHVYALLLRRCYWPVRTLRGIFLRTNPDVVCSLLGATNIITVAASDGLRHRTVISERNDPSKQRLETPWEDLRPVLYPAADAVSANSHVALSSMRSYCPEGKLRHAPNPLILADGTHDTRSNALLFLARLVPQKAPDVLIEAFASFIRTAPGWKLHVAGDGPMAEELQMRVRALGLTDGVTFHGVVTDPTPLLTRCRIFVLPSRFEGTPNALLEAMGHRMACIVSDASPGPLRLIEHGVSGLVVETGSVEGLAGALGELSRDEQLQRKLGDAACERVREFRLDRVAPIWDRILFPDEPADAEKR